MKRLAVLSVIICLIGVTPVGQAAPKPRPLGTIAGRIMDEQGRGLSRAFVRLLNAVSNAMSDRTIQADEQGNFYARNIVPGAYLLRAEAQGYVSQVKAVEVRPDVVLSLKFALQRSQTLLDQREDRHAYRWVVRGVPRPVLRWQPEEASAVTMASAAVSNFERSPLLRGMVQLVSGVPLGSSSLATPFAGVNLALAGQATPNLELVFVGQVSSHTGLPSRMEVIASTFATHTHQVTARLGYARTGLIGDRFSSYQFQQASLALMDAWQVAGPVAVMYGVDVTGYFNGVPQWTVSPRLGVGYALNKDTRLRAEYFPVSSYQSSKQGEFNYEGGQVIFCDPRPLAFVAAHGQAERAERFQYTIERQLDEASQVEGALFFDHYANRGVGLLAVPVEVAGGMQTQWRSLVQDGQARGARVVYQRQLTPYLTGMVGYSFGQGQRWADEPLNEPHPLFQTAPFQVVSLRLDATVTRTRTRISSVYRLSHPDAVFAIDPFYGRLDVHEPNLSVVVTQDIPDLGLLPGRWQASVDARNLLDQNEGATSEGKTLLTQASRSIRGSVSVRF